LAHAQRTGALSTLQTLVQDAKKIRFPPFVAAYASGSLLPSVKYSDAAVRFVIPTVRSISGT
jgi:hypothetical protein